ncbi:MAG: leucine-rich repeat protein, partial [Clostridiales bacterium]|nr:leucine-rich repeat protein [Clostridiales bacterium]
ITIPESVVNIGAGAFSECSHLKELVIPKAVKTLGGAVIDQYCVTVEKVYMSEEFRPMLFVIVDTLNPDIKIYYYNED